MSKNGRNLPFSVSQNFLTSKKIIRRLLNLTTIRKDDHVIEIGAGKGHITRELVKYCGRASAFEIDPKLYEHLRSTLSGAENLNIRRQDFLKASLPKNEPYKVFSNIPFCITTDIMRKLFSCGNPPLEAWLVMEKGAAKRFMGTPRETFSSLSLKPFFTAEIKYHFSRHDFHPSPSADIVLLHVAKKSAPDIPPAQRKIFTGFVETGLKYGIETMLTKRQVSTALKLAGIPNIQSSGLTLYIQWLCLFRSYAHLNKKLF